MKNTNMAAKHKYPVAVVTWLDACRWTGDWTEMEGTALDFKVVSAGFLVRRDKEYVAVARDLDPQSGQVRDIITVPTGWVVKIEVRK